MNKGKLLISRSNKGRWIVMLDRLNNRPPMPLSYVKAENDKFNNQPCEYEVDAKGRILKITVQGQVFYSEQSSTSSFATNPIDSKKTSMQPDSFQGYEHTFLPSACFKQLDLKDIDNFALKYHKAPRWEEGYRKSFKFAFYKAEFRDEKGYKIRSNYGDLNFEAICQRQKEVVRQLWIESSFFDVFTMKTAWRYVQGLGNESVYETGLTLHHVYGCPYIPASIIKGNFRAFIIEKFFFKAPFDQNAMEQAITEAEQNESFCWIFGSADDEKDKTKQATRGKVSFWDALPNKRPDDFELEIMNPHFSNYYAGKQAPTDTESPIPISFLTLPKKGVSFQFILSYEEANRKLDFGSGKVGLLGLLKEALRDKGLGAKTAIGYGYFEEEGV